MNRKQAVQQVAANLAGYLSAGTFEEATGVTDEETLSEADAGRLAWAVEEIERRLYRMGGCS